MGHVGKEYWKSRSHRYGEEPGRFTKNLTHRKERKQNKEVVKNFMNGLDEYA